MSCPDEPQKPRNRPGLPALSYRISDYAAFRDRLLSRIACPLVTTDQPQGVSLRELNTRASDDPAIALLDACAVVADVLTFYQERIINEGFLRTATERRSVLELARMIGYELAPGVAASTMLAFTVEDAPGSPTVAALAKGTQILSIPGQDELPQTFETSTDFTAHVEWNALTPLPSRPQILTSETRKLYLQGTSTNLQPGDTLLLLDGDTTAKPSYLLTLDTVEPNPQAGYTTVTWTRQLPSKLAKLPRTPTLFAFRQRANLFGFNAPRWDAMPDPIKLSTGGKIKGGVYRYNASNPPQIESATWESVNNGLLSFDSRCLTANPKTGSLFVGTPFGIFRSQTNGETWTLNNGGLTNPLVQTIFAGDTGELLAGSTGGGVFRSTDDGETWSPIHTGSVKVTISGTSPNQTSTPENTGIPNTVVHALATFNFTLTGPTLSATERSVTITPGSIPFTLQVGDVILVGNQSRVVTAVSVSDAGVRTYTIDDVFRNPPTEVAPIGTQRDLPSGTAFTAFRPAEVPSNPLSLLTGRSGKLIFAATDMGVYRSENQGQDWKNDSNLKGQVVRSLAACTNLIFARADAGVYQSADGGKTWTPRNPPDGSKVRAIAASGNNVFAATDRGFYRLQGSGDWEAKNTGLTDVDGWNIAINPTNGHVFAFTVNGIFRSVDQGDSWMQWSAPAKNPDLTTVATCVKSVVGNPDQIFVSAAFTGFEKVSDAGWTNFQIAPPLPGQDLAIDLDAPYPKILADSWVVLRDGDRFQPCKVKDRAETQRKDFNLDTKVTRLFTDVVPQPEQFRLRDTTVLAQSEPLVLRDDPLTVAVQQEKIFFDPIWTNKILLREYVAGLQPEHPVIVSGKRIRAEVLNVGGIVQSTDQGSYWQRCSLGLSHTDVTAFTTHCQAEKGTVTHNLKAIQGTDTSFTKELKVGVTLSAMGQTLKIQQLYTDTSLVVETDITAALPPHTSFTYEGNGTGTITSDRTRIMGTSTVFTQELKTGITLKAAGQSRQVAQIESDTSLILTAAFNPELPPGTLFAYAGSGTGTIASDRTALAGSGTQFTTALKIGQAITLGNQTRLVTRIVSDTSLFVDAAIAEPLGVSWQSNLLFVGTAAGVFRSSTNGMTWEPINRGLTTLAIQAIAVQTIPSENRGDEGYALFVGTASGIFRTQPLFQADSEIQWEAANTNLVYPDVRALLAFDGVLVANTLLENPLTDNTLIQTRRPAILTGKVLLAGTVNGGVYRSENLGRTWFQTGLDRVDVQALAIAPNGDLFAGTLSDGVYRSTDGGMTWKPLLDGLTNPNVTSLVAYNKPGTGQVTSSGTTVIGRFKSAASEQLGTTFTTELAVGDAIAVAGQSKRVVNILSDLRLEVDTAFDSDFSQPTNFEILRVMAGTAGSGIFYLKPDPANQPTWEAVPTNPLDPMDLNVLCLAIDPIARTLWAGTATGGLFSSRDDGNLWVSMNAGLTSLDKQLNPARKVNTEFRAIAPLNQTLFAAGKGSLFSPDYLYTVPLRSGDRLQVLAPPTPLPEKGQQQVIEAIQEQKWLLRDRDGFTGVVMTAQQTDIRLQPAAAEDPMISEVHAIALPPQDQQAPLLTLAAPIQHCYDPQTVKIYANVVAATQGETIQEVLGNGDATITHQSFQLKKPPLTYVAATTPSGAETTLRVRVNDILWQEVPSLYGRSPLEPVYITRLADNGEVTITFGDGTSGARLPTGTENVTATYRSGIGLGGMVNAEQLALLKTRPLGIDTVINPLPATGAADPETMAEGRTSAPLTVRTLGRIVSLQDYEDFARAFGGIGKAQADLLWAGETQQVHITVAAIGGGAVLPDTALYSNLVQAIDAARDPVQQVQVDSYEPLAFNLEAKLLLNPRYLPDKVLAAAKASLLRQFAFEQRQFGQPVTAAAAIALLQAVEGVIAVDLDALHRRDLTRCLEQAIPALPARWDSNTRQILPAQLLVISPAGLRLQVEVTP